MKQLKTPILLITFNRPDITAQVFQKIREARPKELFVSVDGPRNDKEKIKVEEVKKIVSKVDWPCKLRKKFNEKNLGCRVAESSAMTWFFDNVEEGIVFEDDCLPGKEFFKFAEEMLAKYRNDERVMHISGNNFLGKRKTNGHSYYFSKYPFSWGWASWKRAWKKYDADMKLYPEMKRRGYLKNMHPSFIENRSINSLFEATYKGLDTWDYQWFFSLAINNGLAVVPHKNLVKNIGFREDSTHTKKLDAYLSIPIEEINFPLSHPPFLLWDREADKLFFRKFFLKRVRNFLIRRTGLVRFFKIYE